ncbi:cbb3-type cytochrome oxidase subunit 3 [Thiopseudomonas acetoxidans]|uniref:Cbb3-type cytochrome c oxidase subunit 3 n=1 Tax=Thiopseudomonas acetoxidans TaxID=3041622 RepID=A0ABT7SL85_9GAMM|nr:cbb3-type cytochrome c oxidase subunit 3 [Thiopseudomonas sp. CY1220]MCK9237819.1 cbb3-type cytochrome c oxidase subunit 3 [Thiopseudomonas sp.]MCK9464998.1 cbb3-type cytochrome c oxidase subunit 3 [Thiopseudomonas sp.]MDM7856947.1 cbb3-type cytochrome c oxidase subunit 3 [Thiopseudomonas sp. CY1220]NLC09893.1 cbb3-type cytochrome c oxidase subunit 3 [Gammaproteobacteria bacterium]
MDIGTIRGIGTAMILIAFVCLVFWAYSSKRKKSFDEAAMLPFGEESLPTDTRNDQNSSRSTHQ